MLNQQFWPGVKHQDYVQKIHLIIAICKCDWVYKNWSELQNWNPLYYLMLKLHSSTTQTNQAHG